MSRIEELSQRYGGLSKFTPEDATPILLAPNLSTKVTRNRFTVSPAGTASFRIPNYGQPG